MCSVDDETEDSVAKGCAGNQFPALGRDVGVERQAIVDEQQRDAYGLILQLL